MKRLIFSIFASLLIVTPAFAQEQGVTAEINSEFNNAPTPVYDFGFRTLSDLIDMGDPITAPYLDEDGNVEQLTTTGMAYWLPDQNQPSFTDGWDRWALTDDGLVDWQGWDVIAPVPPPVPVYNTPYSYLYATYPGYANRINCLVNHESGWNATVINRTPVGREHATGLGQFLPSTWMTTPQGKAGYSIYDPYAQIDAMAWMLSVGRAREWATIGYC